MMFVIKIGIFSFIIISVKLMFVLFFQEEDRKVYMMKEVSDFIEFLRIYSCSMKMSFEEILSLYNFKYENVKVVFYRLFKDLQNESIDASVTNLLEDYICEQISSPVEFNKKISRILDFYGNSMSDVLDQKLSFIKNDINKFIDNFENEYKERKNLLNKLSLLIGSLIAIVLI